MYVLNVHHQKDSESMPFLLPANYYIIRYSLMLFCDHSRAALPLTKVDKASEIVKV